MMAVNCCPLSNTQALCLHGYLLPCRQEKMFLLLHAEHWNSYSIIRMQQIPFSIIIKENSLLNKIFQWNILLLWFTLGAL